MKNLDKYDLNLVENLIEHTLDNGIQLLIDKSDNYNSISVGYYLLKGSRDEAPEEAGYSHFAEHMLFKGTPAQNKKDIAVNFDKMSGYVNAYTTHELVVVYNRVPYYYLEETNNLIHDIYHNSIFPENEVQLEKQVIINEIRSEFEDPHEKVHEDFMRNIFPGNTLGLPIIGNEESIKNVKRDELFDFYTRTFDAANLVIIMAGKVDVDKTISLLNGFKFRPGKKISTRVCTDNNNDSHFMSVLPSEQVHIITGTRHVVKSFEKQLQLGLLNTILGESMSSRLFQKVREDKGLCYLIYTFFNKYRTENLFGLYMSVMPENLNNAIKEVSLVIRELIESGITNEELEQAKNQKIGELILNYDILQKRMSKIAYMKIKYNHIYTFDAIIQIINNTTIDDLNNLVKEIFIKEHFVTQVLYKKKLKYNDWEF